MYRRFYGLQEQPFSLNTDPRFFFANKQYASAKTMLEYALLRRDGVSVVTGEVGCGKSMLIRAFMSDAPEHLVLGVISNPALLEDSPIHGVSQAFRLGQPDAASAQLHAAFQAFLHSQYEAGRAVMLIVDEAQYLSHATLERLRMLTNPEADSEGALQLVLVGQTPLKDTLNHPALNQLRQRVLVNLHLEPLRSEDSVAYIIHRLHAAGAERPIFSDGALSAIYRGSRGVPRMINMLCDMALLYGYAEELPEIDEDVIAQVIADRGMGGGEPAGLPPDGASQLESSLYEDAETPREDVEREVARQVFSVPGGKQ